MSEAFGDFARRAAMHRDTKAVIAVAVVIILSWATGKAVADQSIGLPLTLVGAAGAYMLFFRPAAMMWIAPLAMCIPNFGLDIPGPWAVSIEDAFVVGAFTALLARCIVERRPIIPRDEPAANYLLAFLGLAVLSLVKVVMISPGTLMMIVKDLMRLAMLVLLFFAVLDTARTPANIRTAIRAIILLSVPMAAISWYIYLTESPFFYYILTMKPAYLFYKTKILRMISIMGSTSFSGLYFAIALALAATFPRRSGARHIRLAYVALISVLTSCLVMTFNRGTWVGVLLGLTMLMFLGRLSFKKVSVALILVVALLLFGMTNLFSILDVEQKVNVLVEVSRSSGQARITRWMSAANVMLDQPLLGVGYNNYAYNYGRYSIEEGWVPLYGSPHNMYVDLLTGTGLVGFGIFAMFLRRMWRLHYENWKYAVDPELKSIALGLLLVYVFFVGASLFDSFLFKPHHTSHLVFILFALTAAIRRIRRAEAASAEIEPVAKAA
ncbi:O-antigen ligase family protein [bacterium]|nr:O-antigen ligase family protein [bacterium]